MFVTLISSGDILLEERITIVNRVGNSDTLNSVSSAACSRDIREVVSIEEISFLRLDICASNSSHLS